MTRRRSAVTVAPMSGPSRDGLVRALREAGTMNPVIVLDEVDKIGADFRGDPSSALLEVLDPAQNHTFRDHYLEVDLDLSRVMFIATANVIDTIPGPLLDRMEVIRLDGYTESEKVSIARHHLVGRQLGRAALREDEVEISDEALRSIVADYTREAGVRSLERELGRLLRKVATKLAAGEREAPVVVEASDVRGWLGRPHFYFEAAERTSVPGVVTGLAVTGAGGDVLFVEASMSDGPEGLTLTGQLGDVMKESAEIALSYVRSHADELGIDPTIFAGKRFHVHVPAGRSAKGRTVSRCHHDNRAGESPPWHPRSLGCRDDRRGHAPRSGSPDRRGQAEGARRTPGRAERGGPARAERARTSRTCPKRSEMS